MCSRGNQADNNGKIIKSKVFQINIQEEFKAMQPAVVMKSSNNKDQLSSLLNKGKRAMRSRVNTTYFNESLQMQSHQQLPYENFFSGLRNSFGVPGFPLYSGPSSPKLGLSSPHSGTTSKENLDVHDNQDNRYNRTLMTQRWTNRGIIASQKGQRTLKASETPRENLLPRLNIKSRDGKKRSTKIQYGIQRKTDSNIIVQELHPYRKSSAVLTPKSEKEHVTWFDTHSSQPGRAQRDIYTRGPIVDPSKNYEVLSDDQCILRNSYNIVETNHPFHSKKSTAIQNKAVFKVVSSHKLKDSKKKLKFTYGDDEDSSQQSSTPKKPQQQGYGRKGSIKSSDSEEKQYHKDGTIKVVNTMDEEDSLDGYRDFITLASYFQRIEQLKTQFTHKQRHSKKFLKQIKPDEFIILNQIYPRIYSIKNTLKGTVIEPNIEFNPVHMNQYEIFLVKSVTYLYTHQYEKALYFIDQGINAWPNKAFEFKFNKGLLHYLKEEYSVSVNLYKELLSEVEKQDHKDEVTINRSLSIILNLMLSLFKDGNRFNEVGQLHSHPMFKVIRMLTHTTNLKIQKLLNYSQHQIPKSQQTQIQEASQEENSKNRTENISPVNGSSEEEGEEEEEGDDIIEEEEQDGTKGDDNFTAKEATLRGQETLIAKDKGPALKYSVFKKRGGHDFPLKNIKMLDEIKAKRALEREIRKATQSKLTPQQTFVFISNESKEEHQKTQRKSQSPRRHKISKSNKAQFFNLENIHDIRSPDYVLSMTDIIGRLQQKDDIQRNKTLLYQLQKLDEVVKQRQDSVLDKTTSDPTNVEDITCNTADEAIKNQPMIPFPLEMNERQKCDPLYSEQKEQLQNQGDNEKLLLDQCMRNLEELRLEVSMEYGGEFENVDPIMAQYKIICNSIYVLLKEENLINILQDSAKDLKEKGAKAFSQQKISVAKEILLSALLKRKQGKLTLASQTNDQLVEIELLKDKVSQLKDILISEMSIKGDKKNMDYMEKVEREIKRMLVIARKKQKERERQYKQEQEDMQITLNPNLIEQVQETVLISTKSLSSLLKRSRFQELISERFKVDKKKYRASIENPSELGMKNRRRSVGQLTQEVLNRFQTVDPDQYTKLLERTKAFLQYVIDTYGAFFIAQKTYCMTEILEQAPPSIKYFFEQTSSILTTIPMRLGSLIEAHDDNKWAELCKNEFIYNKDDLIHKLVSQGLRQPKVIEYMGLEKHEWLLEVIQKFNMLAIINLIMREGIKVNCCQGIYSQHFQKAGGNQNRDPKEEEVDEDPDAILNKTDSQYNTKIIEPFLDKDSLNAIKDQYARLKYQGGAFNTSLINKLIGRDIPIFKQFNFEMREKIFRKSHLRSIIIDQPGDQCIDLAKLNKNTILVILNGNMLVQIRNEELPPKQPPQKQTEQVANVTSQKKPPPQLLSPVKVPPAKWTTEHVLGPGMAVPVQFLVWIRDKYSPERFRILANKPEEDINNNTPDDDLENLAADTIDYLEFDNKELADLIYVPMFHSLIKKVELIQNVDLFNGDSPMSASRIEKLSPYVMFALAALCKVQVFNMSELIIAQDETPKSMFVILEGQAKAVYEDKLERKGEVCPFSRRSIRTDLPKELKFGLSNFNQLDNTVVIPTSEQIESPKSILKKGQKTSNKYLFGSNEDLQVIGESTFENAERFNSSQTLPLINYIQTTTKPHSITYQNFVFNNQWSEHQPTKCLAFKHHIEFGMLTEGQYIASRVVLDDGAVKNFIKTSIAKKNEWRQLPPQLAYRQSLTQQMKAGFIATQEKRKYQESDKGLSTDEDEPLLDGEYGENNNLLMGDSLVIPDDNTVTSMAVNNAQNGGIHHAMQMKSQNKHLLSSSGGGGAQSITHSVTKRPSRKNMMLREDDFEVQRTKLHLMKSQLSIVVISSQLKAMVMYKKDKAYFNEPVKKLLTEMISEKNFLDLDRPMQESKDLDFIKSTQKQWEMFKQKYEEHSLRESFHQKYEKFPR